VLAFAVRTEYARADGNYLANESLSVTDGHGQPVLSVSCEGPWILLGLPAGAYHLEASSSEAAPRRSPRRCRRRVTARRASSSPSRTRIEGSRPGVVRKVSQPVLESPR